MENPITSPFGSLHRRVHEDGANQRFVQNTPAAPLGQIVSIVRGVTEFRSPNSSVYSVFYLFLSTFDLPQSEWSFCEAKTPSRKINTHVDFSTLILPRGKFLILNWALVIQKWVKMTCFWDGIPLWPKMGKWVTRCAYGGKTPGASLFYKKPAFLKISDVFTPPKAKLLDMIYSVSMVRPPPVI